ncbi:MAG: hypothetical protein APR63_06840 [Desulfuromonas sp. SDB]|nr:MAG: hypothetical protein APR63_06840 [Desulfuromonas sp. SDB]
MMNTEQYLQLKTRVKRIIRILKKILPNAACHLTYQTPEQLLIATILSAQTRDERVNKATQQIFAKYPTPRELADADIKWLKQVIKPVGMNKTKSARIVDASKKLILDFDGKVPSTMEQLLTIPGVGRKTANLVLSEVFNQPGIIVDTHLQRVTARLGLVEFNLNPEKIEFRLNKIVDLSQRAVFSHLIGDHGRQTCKARKPLCQECCLIEYCCRQRKLSDCQ